MSHVLDALATLDNAIAKLQSSQWSRLELASARAVSALSAQDTVPAKPVQTVLDKLHRDLLLLAKQGRGYSSVPSRDMRHVPWLLWEHEKPLADLSGLLDEVLSRAKERKSLLRALIEAWIAGFSIGSETIRKAASALRRLVLKHSHPSMQAWARVDRTIGLFDPAGPRLLARRLLTSEQAVPDLLAEVGFHDSLRAVSGYMRAVQDELLVLAPDRLAGPGGEMAAERLFASLTVGKDLRFREPKVTGVLARALLSPWLTMKSEATEETRFAVQEFLIHHLNDPRLQPQLWLAAGEQAIALVRRWLTKASLDAFFRIIREHALDSHWRYREAFWRAYLNAGAISDAWLAFAPSVFHDACAVKELRGGFARLDGTGVQPNHSVLLMRIGGLVLCEWSHNGALRAWPVEWKTAPKLTQKAYDRRSLLARCLPFPSNEYGKGGNPSGMGLRHDSSYSGHWQGSVAKLIGEQTHIRLTRAGYMP